MTNVATSFLQRFLWIVPATILGSLALSLLFLAQATRAIRRVSRRAEEISARNLDVRFDANGVPREVRPLVRAMNQALDRVEQSYNAQSEFAANVAHELRNPLATISCRIDEIPDPVLRKRMTRSLADAAHVVDQLMMLARVDGEGPTLGPIDLRSIALEAVEQAAPRIFASGRSIEFKDRSPISKLSVVGNKSLARLSLDNLIDNAQRHTPPGTHICVRLGPGPRMTVEDDGPGIARTDRDRVIDRYWLCDRRADGAGLGLSIVTKAMGAQTGSLNICDSPSGAKLALLFNPLSAWKPSQ